MLIRNNFFNSNVFVSLLLICNYLISFNASADGVRINRVYHPYVQPLEREIEFRLLSYDDVVDTSDEIQIYQLGLGMSFATNWFAEVYVVGENNVDNFEVSAYEVEAKVQLTEQGEYDADWGLLFELEKEIDPSIIELATTLLIEREWGKTVGTANVSLILENGNTIVNEIEIAGAFQLRYRYSRAIEPAIELYINQDTQGIGPVLMGQNKFGIKKKLFWEVGAIAGISDSSPDMIIRVLIELEF